MEDQTIIIKLLKPEDHEIGIKAAGIFYNDNPDIDYMKSFLSNRHNYLIVAILNNHPVGFVLGYQLDSWHQNNKEILLYDIEVLNEYRKLGIGRKLMTELKTIAKKDGFKEIWLPTEKSNIPAVEFYKKMGGIQKHDDDTLFSFNLEKEV